MLHESSWSDMTSAPLMNAMYTGIIYPICFFNRPARCFSRETESFLLPGWVARCHTKYFPLTCPRIVSLCISIVISICSGFVRYDYDTKFAESSNGAQTIS